MGNQIFEEQFTGKYDGVTPATLLEPGALSGGANVRKVSQRGGWKVRKGCTLFKTTALGDPDPINSLHYYKNPKKADAHFIGQYDSKLYDLEALPTGTYSAATSLGVTVGTTPGFSDVVGENWFFADGSGRPITWGGDEPLCSGFVVWDNSETAYIDYTRKVTDGRTSTLAILGIAASDAYFVCSSEIASGIILDLDTLNTTDTAVSKVYSWVAGAWNERTTGYLDGTIVAASGRTHSKDGTISWTANPTDTMSIIGGIMGYWYKVVPQSTYLTDGVTVASCKVVRAATPMTNKWNGIWEWVVGCRFYDHSATEYVEALGLVTNESESQNVVLDSAQTTDFLYFKTVEPATAVGVGMVTDEQNTSAALIDLVEYWNGSAFTTCYPTASLIDTTLDGAADSSFSQSGTIEWDAAALSPQRRTFQGDQIPGYWYRISWAAALGADCAIYMMVYAPFPEVLPAYDGCIEFKGRLFTWGDPEHPNRLRYSALDRPDCFSGSDSDYTDPFGDAKKVLCARRFYNELIVFKEDSIHLLEGYSPQTFGTLKVADTVGLASPKSAHVVEVGSPSMHRDELLSIAIWQDVDGIYVLDGRKPRKASLAIDHYFNPEYSTTVIGATEIRNRQAGIDSLNNEYHFLLSDGELVYNYVTDEWYPPWERTIDIDTWVSMPGADNRKYTYGGSSGGFVMRLENGTTDRTTLNAADPIAHSIKTRAIGPSGEGGQIPVEFTLRKIWARLKARTGYTTGTLTVNTFKDVATSGTPQTVPEAMSMANSGYGIATPGLELSEYRCSVFQVEFALDTADEEMEIWSMPYELAIVGELGT